MKLVQRVALTVLAISVAAACSGSKSPEAKSAAPAAPAAAQPAVASADSVGVPECDEYIQKWEACVAGKVPEAARAQMKAAFDQTRAAWKQAAANPQAKQGLAMGCKQALDVAKQSLAAYNCQW